MLPPKASRQFSDDQITLQVVSNPYMLMTCAERSASFTSCSAKLRSSLNHGRQALSSQNMCAPTHTADRRNDHPDARQASGGNKQLDRLNSAIPSLARTTSGVAEHHPQPNNIATAPASSNAMLEQDVIKTFHPDAQGSLGAGASDSVFPPSGLLPASPGPLGTDGSLDERRALFHRKSRLMSTFSGMDNESLEDEPQAALERLQASLSDAQTALPKLSSSLSMPKSSHQDMLPKLMRHNSVGAQLGSIRAFSLESSTQQADAELPSAQRSAPSRTASLHTSLTRWLSWHDRSKSADTARPAAPGGMEGQGPGAEAVFQHQLSISPSCIPIQTASIPVDDSSSIPQKLVDVEVYSLGTFAFKGLAAHRQIAQLMPTSLSERLALFPHVLKRGKATCVTSDSRLLAVSTAVLPDVSGLVLAR